MVFCYSIALLVPIAYTLVGAFSLYSLRESLLKCGPQGKRYHIDNAAVLGALFIPSGIGNISKRSLSDNAHSNPNVNPLPRCSRCIPRWQGVRHHRQEMPNPPRRDMGSRRPSENHSPRWMPLRTRLDVVRGLHHAIYRGSCWDRIEPRFSFHERSRGTLAHSSLWVVTYSHDRSILC